MIDEIINVYKNHISLFYVSQQKYKLTGRICEAVYLIFGAIISIYVSFFVQYFYPKLFLSILFILILDIVFLRIIIVKRKAYIRKYIINKYNFRVPNKSNIKEVIHLIEESQLSIYLKNNTNCCPQNIDRLAQQIKETINRNRFSNLFIPSMFVALFIPVWVQFSKSVFDINGIDFESSIQLFFAFTVLIFLLVILVSFFKACIKDFGELFISLDKTVQLKLLLRLESLYYKL